MLGGSVDTYKLVETIVFGVVENAKIKLRSFGVEGPTVSILYSMSISVVEGCTIRGTAVWLWIRGSVYDLWLAMVKVVVPAIA